MNQLILSTLYFRSIPAWMETPLTVLILSAGLIYFGYFFYQNPELIPFSDMFKRKKG